MESLETQIDGFYREHRQPLFTYALTITRCPERAEDAIQEAFYRLYRLHTLPDHLRAYVWRAVRNAAIDQRRRVPHTAALVDGALFDPAPDPRHEAVSSQVRERLESALAELCDDERETIVQHLFGELTFREIAQVREISINTITSWYRRGLEKIRARWED